MEAVTQYRLIRNLIQILKHNLCPLLYLVIFTLTVLVPILIWLHVNWSLAYVLAVVESKWGFETLRRSANLLKGKRWVSLSKVLMFYGIVMGIMVVCGVQMVIFVTFLPTLGAAKLNQWMSLGMILPIVSFSMVEFMMNQYIVRHVELYMQCKDLNGENLPLDENNHAIE